MIVILDFYKTLCHICFIDHKKVNQKAMKLNHIHIDLLCQPSSRPSLDLEQECERIIWDVKT